MTTVKEVLAGAKADIQSRGVNRDGRYVNDDGCLCVYGAVMVNSGWEIACEDTRPYLRMVDKDLYTSLGFEAEDTLIAFLERTAQTRMIAWWNDNEATDEQIFELFDAAIEGAE